MAPVVLVLFTSLFLQHALSNAIRDGSATGNGGIRFITTDNGTTFGVTCDRNSASIYKSDKESVERQLQDLEQKVSRLAEGSSSGSGDGNGEAASVSDMERRMESLEQKLDQLLRSLSSRQSNT